MDKFHSQRVTHEFTQTNDAAPEQVFPLLCPVREAEWVPGWSYRLIYSRSGVAERGCVFATPNEDGTETTWLVTEHDPGQFRVSFVWVHPGMVATEIRIALEHNLQGTTSAHIRYTYTGLSPAGNALLERYDQAWFTHKMQSWQTAINHYLRTGTMISASAWE